MKHGPLTASRQGVCRSAPSSVGFRSNRPHQERAVYSATGRPPIRGRHAGWHACTSAQWMEEAAHRAWSRCGLREHMGATARRLMRCLPPAYWWGARLQVHHATCAASLYLGPCKAGDRAPPLWAWAHAGPLYRPTATLQLPVATEPRQQDPWRRLSHGLLQFAVRLMQGVTRSACGTAWAVVPLHDMAVALIWQPHAAARVAGMRLRYAGHAGRCGTPPGSLAAGGRHVADSARTADSARRSTRRRRRRRR